MQIFSSDSCPLLLLIEDTAGNNCSLKAMEAVFSQTFLICSVGLFLGIHFFGSRRE